VIQILLNVFNGSLDSLSKSEIIKYFDNSKKSLEEISIDQIEPKKNSEGNNLACPFCKT
jgi:hypothetical protein